VSATGPPTRLSLSNGAGLAGAGRPGEPAVYHQTFHGKQRVRGQFSLGDGGQAALYDLSITEPHWEELVIQQGPRTLRQVDHRFVLTISLGEPYGLDCYKLIAAIIPLPPALAGIVSIGARR